ncbi:Leucine-rich repeat-containing 16B [Gossypium arboreum]|uniref:Leucine-rich repeat-containing 16B n=1 Tax=Gossypium arboreum TaxID=29729 RepID=A0A0B0M994_GOSAR|nr:Leucine-rich repeat-containing 16B [Gossypium arboreum]
MVDAIMSALVGLVITEERRAQSVIGPSEPHLPTLGPWTRRGFCHFRKSSFAAILVCWLGGSIDIPTGVLVGTGGVLAGMGWVALCIYTDTILGLGPPCYCLRAKVIPKLRWFGAARDSEMATLLLLFLLFAIRFHFRF